MSDIDASRAQRAIDRTEIQYVLSRYSVAIDTRDVAMFDTVFSEDAELDFGGFRGVMTRAQFKDRIANLTYVDSTQHLMGLPTIDVDGDRATTRTYFASQHVRDSLAPHHTMLIGGWYDDAFERIGGEWLITSRRVTGVWAQGNPAVMGAEEFMGNRRPQDAAA